MFKGLKRTPFATHFFVMHLSPYKNTVFLTFSYAPQTGGGLLKNLSPFKTSSVLMFGVVSYWSSSRAYGCCSSDTVMLLLYVCTHNTEICGCSGKDSYNKAQRDVVMSDILNPEMHTSHLRASLAHGMSSVCVAVWTFRRRVANGLGQISER